MFSELSNENTNSCNKKVEKKKEKPLVQYTETEERKQKQIN